jgi:hypothetical protein
MDNKNEVIVVGTIHSQHLSSEKYSLKVFSDIIKNLNPDVVLAEIPTDRFLIADEQFQKSGKIDEPRVLQYPEFSKVIFPLQKELGFSLEPVSAWTEEMANAREKKLEEIKADKNRAKDWETYIQARQLSGKLFENFMEEFDPIKIHSNDFDQILNIELQIFSDLFNDDLGKGGWENINQAHYKQIDFELNKIINQKKRVVLIFGSGHKGWLVKKLQSRTDIILKNLLEVI